MQSRDFCYWLQGYFEINGANADTLTSAQLETIKKHLSLVFVHEIDPSMGPKEHQDKLNNIHTNPVMRC
jgi:hypothetical protein